MGNAQLVIDVPENDINFLNEYAKRHHVTISALIDQYIKQLQVYEKYKFHPDIEKNTGIIPKTIDVKNEYYEYLEEKHK